jgi:hypothetical protein
MSVRGFLSLVMAATWLAGAASPALGEVPRQGGWLTLRLREDLPQGFAIHESPTISTMWPDLAVVRKRRRLVALPDVDLGIDDLHGTLLRGNGQTIT